MDREKLVRFSIFRQSSQISPFSKPFITFSSALMSDVLLLKMIDNKLKIDPPLYLVGKYIHCWNCEEKMPAVALLSPNVDGEGDEICILSDIQELPRDVYFFIKKRVPSFKMRYSKMAGHKYLGNTCPKCGLLSGEFFLHAEPGGPFFPEDENDAKSLYIRELPLTDSIAVTASVSMGVGDVILKNSKRLE